jgi:site-specific recombinase XerD
LQPPGKEIRVMYEKDSFLREHAKEITEIIEATGEDPENEEVRAEIAAALSASLHSKKMRARSVKDTDLYRLAQAVKQAGGEQECVELVKRAFPRRWSVIFEKYNFAWKFSCRETRPTRRKEPPKKTAKSPTSGIEEEIQGLETTMKELDEWKERWFRCDSF